MGDDLRTNKGEAVFLEPSSGNDHNEMAQQFRGRARLDPSLADVFTTCETSKVPFHRDGRDMTRPGATMSKSHEAKSNKKERSQKTSIPSRNFSQTFYQENSTFFTGVKANVMIHCYIAINQRSESTLFRAFPAPQEVGTARGTTSKRTGGAQQMLGHRLFRNPGTVEPRTAIRQQPMPRLSLP